MTYDNANEFIEEAFELLYSRYLIGLDGVDLMYCKCHKIDFKRRGLYIESLHWIHLKSKDDRYFQYAITIALNFDQIKKDPNIKAFIIKYNWDRMKYPSK